MKVSARVRRTLTLSRRSNPLGKAISEITTSLPIVRKSTINLSTASNIGISFSSREAPPSKGRTSQTATRQFRIVGGKTTAITTPLSALTPLPTLKSGTAPSSTKEEKALPQPKPREATNSLTSSTTGTNSSSRCKSPSIELNLTVSRAGALGRPPKTEEEERARIKGLRRLRIHRLIFSRIRAAGGAKMARATTSILTLKKTIRK